MTYLLMGKLLREQSYTILICLPEQLAEIHKGKMNILTNGISLEKCETLSDLTKSRDYYPAGTLTLRLSKHFRVP